MAPIPVEKIHCLDKVLGFLAPDPSMISNITKCQLSALETPLGEEDPLEITTIDLPDEIPFSFVAIREIMTEMQAALFRWTYSHDAVRWLNQLKVDVAKSSPSPSILCDFPCNLDSEFFLPVAGTVSLTPTINSYPLCVPKLQLKRTIQ